MCIFRDTQNHVTHLKSENSYEKYYDRLSENTAQYAVHLAG